MKKIRKGGDDGGFTLIELLIVIAVIGALAAIVLIAVNPLQQLAKARDTNRLSTIRQVGSSLAAYAAGGDGTYLDEGAGWMTALQTSGELGSVPGVIPNSLTPADKCTSLPENEFCYNGDIAVAPTAIIAYTTLEADASEANCPVQGATTVAYAVWDSVDGRAGVVCVVGGEPVPGGNQTYVN